MPSVDTVCLDPLEERIKAKKARDREGARIRRKGIPERVGVKPARTVKQARRECGRPEKPVASPKLFQGTGHCPTQERPNQPRFPFPPAKKTGQRRVSTALGTFEGE